MNNKFFINDNIINKVSDYLIVYCGLIDKNDVQIDIDSDMSRVEFIKIYNRTMSEIKEIRHRVLVNREAFAKFVYEILVIQSDTYDVDVVYKYFVNIIDIAHDKFKINKLKYL